MADETRSSASAAPPPHLPSRPPSVVPSGRLGGREGRWGGGLGKRPFYMAVGIMGDRFYGNADIISWCQTHGWDYCLRLKGSMFLAQEPDAPPAQDRKLSALWATGEHRFENAYLTRRRVQTNIQMIQDAGAQEPWFIAMSAKPSLATARAYAKRWGIEAMFSDFKSRGFGLTQSQLRSPGKLNRLIMIMAIALYWAVSTGLWAAKQIASQKNSKKSVVDQWFHHSKQA